MIYDNFFKREGNNEEPKVLLIPNITYQRDLGSDSYIQVVHKMCRLMSDYHFISPQTELLDYMNLNNVEQRIINLPTYPNAMRAHFKSKEWEIYDPDVIFSHLPEWTYQIKQLFPETSIIGYSHWFEFKEVTNYPRRLFRRNVIGILEMERCFVNTEAQRQLLLEEASEYFNERVINRLDEVTTPFHLGVDENDVVDDINDETEKIIVFNHRPDTYKHFPQFVKTIDKLWEQRKDFEVWVPLKGKSDKEWMNTEKFEKAGYYEKLQRCRVGVSPKQVYRGWSVSTTDGLMNGCPYVMYDDLYYHELWNEAENFGNEGRLISLLNKYLDNENHRNEMAQRGLNHIRNNLIYDIEPIESALREEVVKKRVDG